MAKRQILSDMFHIVITIVLLLHTIPCMADFKDVENLESGEYCLQMRKGYNGFFIVFICGNEKVACMEKPAKIIVRSQDTLSSGKYEVKEYACKYSSVAKTPDGLRAVACLTTEPGAVFIVEDIYKAYSDGTYLIDRTVRVEKSEDGDVGFSSELVVGSCLSGGGTEDYEYFIPSILYKDTSCMRKGAVASDMSVGNIYVKETRTGLPMIMLRHKSTGHSMTLVHHKPCVSVGKNPGGGVHGEVNDSLCYGSIGLVAHHCLGVSFRYPCMEGPRTYEPGVKRNSSGQSWSERFHSVRKGNKHGYSVALVFNRTNGYNEAMSGSFRTAYGMEAPVVADMDMNAIYDNNIALFKAEYKAFGKGDVISAGLPWSLDLPDGTNKEGVSFQMGFVGQQIAVGYHLYRYGICNNDIEAKEKGESIVDFWVSDAIMSTYFPVVWWDPADNLTAGRKREYPTFLRCLVDGMEGLLDACRAMNACDENHPQWDSALRRLGEHLLERQNDDGSFYRAYKTNGDVEDGGDRNTQGLSKLNTPVAVRFLAKMYEYTGEDKYRTAAVKAADFAYDRLYKKMGKYVGGTPDNPNTVDKEAAIFALYAFNAAHSLTGDIRYLAAAEHAAVCAMSWAYCYDFSIPNRNAGDARMNPFANGGVIGFSIISTGHSGADNFMAYTFFEMYKLYIKTGDELYLHMARFLQNNTKLNTDFNGRMGYKYKAFMPEATNVADMAFRSVSLWLPWASIANIEPIVQLGDAFGETDIDSIGTSIIEQRMQLDNYGIGGRPLRLYSR